MSRLPVRTGADVHLADAFAGPGCPLCRERARTEQAYLESILSESVNDVAFRAALDAGRGFCGRHARSVLDADRRRAGSLGAAILLRATLAARLPEIAAAHRSRGWGRARKVADAARPPACPACARVARTDAGLVESLAGLTADPAWAAAASAAPFCLDHLLALMAVRSAPAAWPAIEARQLERVRHLRDLLEGFAHASSHDRRHRQTDEQRGAIDATAALLAGEAPGDAAPGRGGAAGTDAAGTDAAVADAACVLLTGVYGAGKTTVAIELVDRLGAAGGSVAGIDLDWLGWYAAPVAWDEHEDPRLTLENLAALRRAYLAAGVRRFVIAGTVTSSSTMERLRAVLAMPVTVVRLRAPAPVIADRLAGDPNASRADDLRVAMADLEREGTNAAVVAPVDWEVAADRPVAEVAAEILDHLGWTADALS